MEHRRVVSFLVATVVWAVASNAQPPSAPSPSPAVQELLDQGLSKQATRSHADAVTLLRRADKEAGGTCAPCLGALMNSYEALGAFQDTATAARRFIALHPGKDDEIAACLKLGVALSRPETKDAAALAEATSVLRRAVELANGTVPAAHFHLGVALIRQGDAKSGVNELEAYLDLQPPGRFQTPNAAGTYPPTPAWARRFVEDPSCVLEPCVPDFALVTSEGTTLTREDLAGQVFVLYFGGYVAVERSGDHILAALEQMAARMKNSPVRVLSIVGESNATRPEWSTRVIFARPASASAPSLSLLLGVTGWPDTFVIDHRGHIVYHQSGAWTRVPEETIAAVRRALKAVPKTAGK